MDIIGLLDRVEKISAGESYWDIPRDGKKRSSIVAELKNGFAIAYEKEEREVEQVTVNEDGETLDERIGVKSEMSYCVLPIHKHLAGGDIAKQLETGESTQFSRNVEIYLQRYVKHRPNTLEASTQTYREIYSELHSHLQVEEYAHRDWKELGIMAAMIFSWPVSVPYYCIRQKLSNGDFDPSGGAGLATFLAPLALPMLVKGLLFPSERSKRICNKGDLLRKENGVSPAIQFNYSGTARRFYSASFIFPDGAEVHDGFIHNDERSKKMNQEKYGEAKYFLPLGDYDDLRERIEECTFGREREYNRWSDFRKELRKEDHQKLLRHVGFL